MNKVKISIVCILIFVVAGCGKKPTEKKKTTIAVISPALTSTFHIEVAKGAKEEADKLGYDIKMPAPKSY